jgi:hypothetical protein
MIKNIYKFERLTYSDLEINLIEDFDFKTNNPGFPAENIIPEFKEEIYWVSKFLQLIHLIQDDSDGLISISSEGMKFLNTLSLDKRNKEDAEYLVEIKDYYNSFKLELDPIVIPYSKLAKFSDEVKVKNTLNSFYCSKDPDIQDFIRNKMKRFEDKSISRSYLILDRKNNDNENFYILGFFTLSLKALYLDQKKLTRRQKRDMNLLKDQDVIPSYFVAQLGKNDMFKYNFNGEYLLNEAVNIIYQCIEILGGTVVWLEANKEADYVVNFYKYKGFIELQSEIQEDGVERIQMIKYLNRE